MLAQSLPPVPFTVQAQAELAEKPAFSNTTRTAGAISSTFILTDTAALYMTTEARQRSATSKPAGQVHVIDGAGFKGAQLLPHVLPILTEQV